MRHGSRPPSGAPGWRRLGVGAVKPKDQSNMKEAMMSKTFVGVSVLAALAASPALAADMPVKSPAYAPPIATWAGGYIGVNGGAGVANAEFLDPDHFDAANTKFQTPFGTAGGQIGYNWQSRAMVIGLEADINWASVSASKTVALNDGDHDGTARFKLDAFATLRARMGLAYENALVYVTAGPAIGHFKSSATFGDRHD